MTRHERFLAKLAETAREYEEKVRPEDWVKSRLTVLRAECEGVEEAQD